VPAGNYDGKCTSSAHLDALRRVACKFPVKPSDFIDIAVLLGELFPGTFFNPASLCDQRRELVGGVESPQKRKRAEDRDEERPAKRPRYPADDTLVLEGIPETLEAHDAMDIPFDAVVVDEPVALVAPLVSADVASTTTVAAVHSGSSGGVVKRCTLSLRYSPALLTEIATALDSLKDMKGNKRAPRQAFVDALPRLSQRARDGVKNSPGILEQLWRQYIAPSGRAFTAEHVAWFQARHDTPGATSSSRTFAVCFGINFTPALFARAQQYFGSKRDLGKRLIGCSLNRYDNDVNGIPAPPPL
jgi:hypothetical protein